MKLFALIPILIAAVTAKADMPAVHGMLIFGQKATYASHLPMFHHPHDYQLVMKVNFTPGAVLARYEALKAKGETLFTIAPKPMDLTQVMNGSLPQFAADLYHGHFERGGSKIGQIQVSVEKFVINTKLNPAAPEKLQYLVFGGDGEYFAAHLIQGKPSHDYIASVSAPYNLVHLHCRTRLCEEPKKKLLPDSVLPLTALPAILDGKIPEVGETLSQDGEALVNIVKVIYLEEEELAH